MINPMLAETGQKPFNRKGFIFEPKLDGVRCIAFLDGETRLQSRSGSDISAKFPELAGLHRQVKTRCILDGEIVGRDFNAIQHRIHQESPFGIRLAQRQYPAFYYVFDILYIAGESVKEKPLIERKALLQGVLAESYQARFTSWQIGYGVSLFNKAKEQSLEGIMAKAMYSPYLEGKRSDAWLKIKTWQEGTFYICGLTEGENDRASTFGSIILGERQNGKLVYVGNVGSGLTQEELRMLLKLEAIKAECPFDQANTDRPVKFWTQPCLQCETRFLERSPDGKLRFPTFRKLIK